MKKDELKLGSRLLIGGIAGFVGTLAMTAAMRRMREKLPAGEHRPPDAAAVPDPGELPPNESDKDAGTAVRFAQGAASGALLGVANVMVGPVSGGVAGIGIWLAGQMGWIPGVRPPRRNLMALASHIIWGVTTARTMRELVAARETILDEGSDRGAPPEQQP